MKEGAQINYRNYTNNTALMMAVENGYTKMTDLLLQKGAKFNYRNNNDETALIIASEKGYEEIVDLLLQKDVDIDYVGYDNNTALIIAVENGYREIEENLLRAGVKAVTDGRLYSIELQRRMTERMANFNTIGNQANAGSSITNPELVPKVLPFSENLLMDQ